MRLHQMNNALAATRLLTIEQLAANVAESMSAMTNGKPAVEHIVKGYRASADDMRSIAAKARKARSGVHCGYTAEQADFHAVRQDALAAALPAAFAAIACAA